MRAVKLATFISLIFSLALFSCNKNITAIPNGIVTTNSAAAEKKPYLILISLDGFRWDYVERFQPPNLTKFIEDGVKAASLIPSFPTKTFPNHYTIVTGMYPDKHGILSNSFYSYDTKATYRINDREQVQDGRYYGGMPIWMQANNAGMVTASYYFVGSETKIRGIQPTYYYDYDDKIKKETRIKQTLDWLAMPAEKRPHMITLYFSDMDDIGHKYGPNNDEQLKKALAALDKNLGDLFDGLEKSKLPVNVIIVSDHGMANVEAQHQIALEDVLNDSLYRTVSNGAFVSLHPRDAAATEKIYALLKAKENHFKIYRTQDTPGFEYTPISKNWGSLQIIPDFGYYFTSKRTKDAALLNREVRGEHGFDQKYKEMHGIFYGNGPAFKNGFAIPSVKNINIYPLMCKILGLAVPKEVDGKLSEMKAVLK
jgi:predicted AlkP superfamily pyrophosphatase or phosphodiesterase